MVMFYKQARSIAKLFSMFTHASHQEPCEKTAPAGPSCFD